MPDEHKLKALRDMGFRIVETCESCEYRRVVSGFWAECLKHKYDHKKHSQKRHPSVTANGWCSDYIMSEASRKIIGVYIQFYDDPKKKVEEEDKFCPACGSNCGKDVYGNIIQEKMNTCPKCFIPTCDSCGGRDDLCPECDRIAELEHERDNRITEWKDKQA